MCLALLLHPLNPEDFLMLACTTPFDTTGARYGLQATVLFWIAAVPFMVGIAGIGAMLLAPLRRILHDTRRHQSLMRFMRLS